MKKQAKKEGNSKEDAQKITDEYIKISGLTSFKSNVKAD